MYFSPLFQNSEKTAHTKYYLHKHITKCIFWSSFLEGGLLFRL